ncbi:MAG: hypothetical protein COT18_12765 [Elusimicrobia bacterium CG08_land_8_20_14_0_20_59_10]|nr:MAG: hypothetical protein COT18_12765 [Elusimicrobia bacterium CG08_land_8_20_14_0_20_59_10]
MRNRVLTASCAAAVFSAVCVYPLQAGSDAGATASNFLKIPVAALPSGMAEAYTAMVGPDSILYNPAGLGLLSYSSVSGTHNQYLAGISQDYVAVTYRSAAGTLGAAYSSLSSGEIDAYNADDMPIGHTGTSHKVCILSFSQSWPHFNQDAGRLDPMLITPSWTKVEPVTDYRPRSYRVSAGASVKRITEELDVEKAAGYAFDAGLVVLLPRHLHLGASVLNMGGKQKMVYESYPLPLTMRLGFAKDFHTVGDLMIFTLASDMVKYRDRDFFNATGVEVDMLRMFQFRFGYTSQKDEGKSLSGGFGMNFDRLADKDSFIHGVRADYAYLDYGDLGATHRFGVQLIW